MRRFVVLIVIALFTAPAGADDLGLFGGKAIARISVTLDPDETGTIRVPSPFCVLPGTQKVALFVPASDGIFLLLGPRILHHFPLPVSEVHDLEISDGLVVAGRRPALGRVTADLEVFDLSERRHLERVQSANPYLRIDAEGFDLWRVLAEAGLVGIYHPPAGASYPLWARGEGIVPSSDQIARASPGIGFGRSVSWIPHPDGTLVRTERGRSSQVAGPDQGTFVDLVSDDEVLLLQPVAQVRSADGEFLLSRELAMRWLGPEGTTRDFRLKTVSSDVRAKRLAIEGRAVRAHDDLLHWIFVGYDYLEIRSLRLSTVRAAEPDVGSR